MRILVAGATGLVGRRLVRRLLEAGHGVAALTRSLEVADATLPVPCDFYEWDPAHGNIDPAAMQGIDAVINLAGENVGDGRWTPENKWTILHSRLDTTRVLLGAIRDLPADSRPRTFVSASGVGIYGDRPDEVLDELSALGEGFLCDVCRAWENEVARAEELGLRTVAMRTGVVLSREGGALAKMLPAFRLGLGGRLGSGKQWVSWIHVDDLASLYLFALETEGLRGPVNAVSPKPVTNAQFTKSLRLALKRPALLPLPASVLGVVLGEMAEMLLGSQRVHPAEAQAEGFPFEYVEFDHALADLCADSAVDYEQEIWIERNPEDVFAYYADVHNLAEITPLFVGLRVVDTSTGTLDEGTVVDCRLRISGIPLRWQSRIEKWDPPRRFDDATVKGPCRSWRHVHEFEPFDDGTIVRDRIHYELRGGAIAAILAGGFVRRRLDRIFAYRRAHIYDFFG